MSEDFLSHDDERDWPSDAYQYQCKCVLCGHMFIGDKRRQCCRKCIEETSLPPMDRKD